MYLRVLSEVYFVRCARAAGMEHESLIAGVPFGQAFLSSRFGRVLDCLHRMRCLCLFSKGGVISRRLE